VFDQVSAFLEASNLLDPHQAAYRRGFSTQTALIRTLDEVRQAADSRKVTIAVFFDFSKAFDNVCHELLINKLRCLKFSSSSLRWFCAYLDHRMQAVQDVSNNIMSSFRIVSKGVPQGSVLGPLLFVLYLSDFGEILRHCKYNFYADDLMIYLHAEPGDLTRAIEQLNEDIRHVEDWACRNQLSLNSDKTSAMILGTARYINNISTDMIPQIRVSNVAIQFKESVVYLGITISNTLAWDIQVAKTVARVNATLYQLKLCGHLLPLPLRSRLVASLVLPLFDYCCAVLTDITAVLNTKLQRALNACVRYIYRAKWDEHISPYFDKLEWLKIGPRRKYFVGCLIFNILLHKRPTDIFHAFKFRDSVSLRATRAPNNLVLPLCRTELYRKSFRCSAVELWNSLPIEIRSADSINIFKERIFNFLLRSGGQL